MAVVIRMKRTGRKNRPCYRISVADRRSPRDGKFLETLGVYDPVSKDPEKQVSLNVERAQHWLEHGALPSDTVASLFRRQGVYEGREEKQTTSRKRRRNSSARGKRVRATKQVVAEAKKVRHTERIASKRAAAKAAAESSEE
ncbi:30S ribosomal protein S16 [bacterium]|nr:MAG: 30S ribosomal protein S16 [bacterium]